jgi:phytoene/squalene synthetase
LLGKEIRNPIYGVYGFVRLADEIVDTYPGANKKELLDSFRADTYKAIEEQISMNPVLQAFQYVVHRYNISEDLIEAFFRSMEMDLHHTTYSKVRYDSYIFGSAEVVGLMCLNIFLDGNEAKYKELKESAQRLGAAFQKVNFLRDLKDDYENRGRLYFPSFNTAVIDEKALANINLEIQADLDAAYEGVVALPKVARLGVYTAYTYYKELFNKIMRLRAEEVLQARIRISNYKKVAMIVNNYLRITLRFT